MLTLLTATGARATAFAQCAKYMARQDYAGPVRWVIVDDGPSATPLPVARDGWSIEVVRPTPLWTPGDNTQGRNLRIGIEKALDGSDDDLRLVVIEDDDWYAPQWLSAINAALDDADLAGEQSARWYNVAFARYGESDAYKHASLRASGVKGAGVALLRDVVTRPVKLFDMELWRSAARLPRRLMPTSLTVGVKAMPGRGGIAAGHDGKIGYRDEQGAVLRRWFGDDAELYMQMRRPEKMADNDVPMIALRQFTYRTRQLKAGDPFAARPRHVRAFERHDIARLEQQTKKTSTPTVKPPRRRSKSKATDEGEDLIANAGSLADQSEIDAGRYETESSDNQSDAHRAEDSGA